MTVPPPLFVPPLIVGWLFLLLFLTNRISGWGLLARRFRAPEPWRGQSWRWQSAQFRGWFGYNNCLTIGADRQWLSLSTMPIFRLFFHPPLVIPWHEIEVETGKSFWGLYGWTQLRIGTEERVTVRVNNKVAERLRQAAGAGWPLHSQEQSSAR
jgi:hypothetical protein